MKPPAHVVTRLLSDASQGRQEAWNQLVPLVYDELRQLADAQMRNERPGHTLQPTALVSEAFLRLFEHDHANFNNRSHFFGAAAQIMRRILVDHARARLAEKRGGQARRADLDDALLSFEDRSTDVLALDEALSRLADLDTEQARIVELRFFGGLSVEETAGVLKTSPSTVERGWRVARAWLLRALSDTD
ncbi:MAG: sigma-70 family RNA polymerase sigma factor [Planctomycetes bacterium]|nr:sigma-70 family RNA polymerase sigma factor [Planctomycetota bacterium]